MLPKWEDREKTKKKKNFLPLPPPYFWFPLAAAELPAYSTIFPSVAALFPEKLFFLPPPSAFNIREMTCESRGDFHKAIVATMAATAVAT